ncbi:MAG: TonB-dependent receptor [Cyclobacteriaceae bacterium]
MKPLITVFIIVMSMQLGYGQSEKERYMVWLDSMTNDEYIGIEIELDQVVISDSAHLAHLNNPMMQMNMRCTDQLMHCLPGVNMIRRGNFANEPMLRGLTSDRYVMSVDGMRIYGACTDKMDPASSYIEPINLKSLDVSFGSEGNMVGCGTGGGVNFGLKKPVFNSSNPFGATINTSYSSVSNGFDQSLDLNYSLDKWAIRLSGVHRKSENYTDGNGEIVRYSQFEKTNYTTSLNYRPNSSSLLAFDFVADDARNVGYPALPMDVAYAKAKMFGLSYLTDRLWILKNPEVKLYHNFINHEMDDTQRDSVAMHMDMPGNTRTTGGFVSGILHHGRKSSLKMKADFHKVFWHAEMTMYPNESDQLPMFMLTWPDIHRTIGGIEFGHEYTIAPDHQLSSTARVELGYSYISSEFGERQLSVFGKTGMDARRGLLLSTSIKHLWAVSDMTNVTTTVAYGERFPTASEQFGFYLFNQQDGYDYLGDPDLKKEQNLHLEIGQTTSGQNFQLETAAFAYFFSNYIMGVYDSTLSSMTIGARGVKWYRNTGNTLMLGGELLLRNKLSRAMSSELNAKYVYGKDADGEPLPQMPPLKLSYSIHQQVKGWSIQPEIVWSSAQKRTSDKFNEQSTDSFFLVNMGISKAIELKSGVVRAGLSVNNMTNESYREHFDIGSILRPGRSIDVLLSWRFN